MFAVTISVNTLTMLFKDKFNVDLFLSIAGLVLAVLMSALMLLRIPKEEKILHEEFGNEWEDYCKRTTKKVIPFVY
jgi:protein-S-isoprenylcysteine O-methyltransferase Ste14